MDSLIDKYLQALKQYVELQHTLHQEIDKAVTLQAVNEHSFLFYPTQSCILAQIRHWPPNEFMLPPAAWVQPRKGSITYNNESWDFAFHGAGVSFSHTENNHDISIEYTATGELGLTQWTIQLYLETIPRKTGVDQDLLAQASALCQESIKQGFLKEVPPLLGQGNDDQTFILHAGKIYTKSINLVH